MLVIQSGLPNYVAHVFQNAQRCGWVFLESRGRGISGESSVTNVGFEEHYKIPQKVVSLVSFIHEISTPFGIGLNILTALVYPIC